MVEKIKIQKSQAFVNSGFQQVWFAPQDYLAGAGDIFGCYNLGLGQGTTDDWVEIMIIAKYPIMHRTAPQNKTIIWLKMSILFKIQLNLSFY